MTPDIDKLKALVEAYENLPVKMGKDAQESACRFINENRQGFKCLTALIEQNERYRKALSYCSQQPSYMHPLSQAPFLVAQQALEGGKVE